MKKQWIIGIMLCMTLTGCIRRKTDNVYQSGIKYLDAGSYQEAIESFQQAIKIDPKNVQAYQELAAAYQQNNDNEQYLSTLYEGYEKTQNADIKQQVQNEIWAVAPTLTNDGIIPAFQYDPGGIDLDYYGVTKEGRGYAAQIGGNDTYSGDVVIVAGNCMLGFANYEGEILSKPIYSSLLYFHNKNSWYGTVNHHDNSSNAQYLIGTDYQTATATGVIAYGLCGGGGAVVENGQFTVRTDAEGCNFITKDNLVAMGLGDKNIVRIVDQASGNTTGMAIIDQSGSVLSQFEGIYAADRKSIYNYYKMDEYDAARMNDYVFIQQMEPAYLYSSYVNGMIRVTEQNPDDVYQQIVDGKVAFINADTEKQICDFIYDDAWFFEDGYCPVEKDGKWGFIDQDGTEVTDFIFDKAIPSYQGKTYVKVNGHWGVLDLAKALTSHVPVNADIVGYSATTEVPASGPDPLTDSTIGSVTVLVDSLNIRDLPSSSGKTIGQCEKGKTYPVYSIYKNDNGQIWYCFGFKYYDNVISDVYIAAKEGEWTTYTERN